MEEYAYERGPKSTQDISSCSKGSSYEEEEDEERYASNEVEEDEERYASSEEQVVPLLKVQIFYLRFLFFSTNSSLACQP